MNEFKEIIVLYKQSDIALVKSLLEAQGIPFFIDNENFNIIHGSAIGARVRVAEEKFDEAKEVLSSFLQ